MGLMTAALLLGAGSAAYGAVEAANARKDAQKEMRKNETAAREAARLDQTKEDAGADIVLGTDGDITEAKQKRSATKRKTVTGPPSLGLGIMPQPSMGTAVGLR